MRKFFGSKLVLATLHTLIGAASVAAALNVGNTKTGGMIVAAGSAANAILASPLMQGIVKGVK